MICSVVGTRPQYIKAAILHKTLKMDVIDTGQHYDHALAGQYLEEFGLPVKTIGGPGDVSHMYQRLIPALERYKTVIVYGDCNTTLAAALAAWRLGKRLIHVEAGQRAYNRRMTEESIRVTVDQFATVNLCSTESAVENLERENRTGHFVGDLEQDYINGLEVDTYIPLPTLTIHRAENIENIPQIFDLLRSIPGLIVWPRHPKMERFTPPVNIIVESPLSYERMLTRIRSAPYVITDSGGVQKEAYMLRTKCLTLREDTEWPETLVNGWNTLIGCDEDRTLQALNAEPGEWTAGVFGDGHAAERIAAYV